MNAESYSGVRVNPAVCRVMATQDAGVYIFGNEGGTANNTSSLSWGGVFLFSARYTTSMDVPLRQMVSTFVNRTICT